MSRFITILALFVLSGCATPREEGTWAQIEGCWIDGSDAIPPAWLRWRADPEHPGGFLGEWRVSIAGDLDAVDFSLTPTVDGMEFCERAPGAEERCAPARLGVAAWRQDDVAVVDVSDTQLEFGFSGASAPFFWGRRGACGP